jgi:hypothetical protein
LADGRSYKEATFFSAELASPALHLKLDYPKTYGKKNVQLPVPLEISTQVPAGFTIQVEILCNADDSEELASLTSERAQAPSDTGKGSEAVGQVRQPQEVVMAAESGRNIYLKLQKGHDTGGEDVTTAAFMVLQGSNLQPQKSAERVDGCTSPGVDAVPEQPGESGSGPEWEAVDELCAVTQAGTCQFSEFKVGADATSLEPGMYSLVVFSKSPAGIGGSEYLQEQRIAVQLNGTKGRKK